MPNKNYKKGRRKEYSIIERLKKQGFDIVQRSKGSHSPIDVFAINKKTRQIKFIQSKSDSLPESEVKKLMEEQNQLSGAYIISFEVM